MIRLVKKRPLPLFGLLLIATLAAAYAIPTAYWGVRGIWNHESFFRHRPTSYWSGRIAEMSFMFGRDADGNMRAAYLVEVPFAKFRRAIHWGPSCRELSEDEIPFADSDPTALPMLIELTTDKCGNVRQFSADRIGQLGRAARCAEPALRRLLDDSDETVANAAEEALGSIGAELPPDRAARRKAELDRFFCGD